MAKRFVNIQDKFKNDFHRCKTNQSIWCEYDYLFTNLQKILWNIVAVILILRILEIIHVKDTFDPIKRQFSSICLELKAARNIQLRTHSNVYKPLTIKRSKQPNTLVTAKTKSYHIFTRVTQGKKEGRAGVISASRRASVSNSVHHTAMTEDFL